MMGRVTPDRSARVLRLFDELVDLDAAARDARLRALGAESPVAREVASLLAAAARAGDFLGLQHRPAPSADSPAPTGLVADRYQVVRRLGRGAMGDVFLAWDEQLARLVALKFLRAPPAGADEGAIARFRAEARAAAQLDHLHVGTVYDAGETAAGERYIVMAYYAGETLRERLARGPLPTDDALRIAAQLADALAAAHAAGIVHRDVKPANVLFDAKGGARLMDFGVATLLADPDAASHGVAIGTPAYMSPEQARGEGVDARADLWALGATLHEMLTGRRPEAGAAVPEVGVARALLAALLSEDRTRRPGTAREVRAALDALRAPGNARRRASSPTVGRGALPHAPTSLVGRARELAATARLLRETRLLTLTGPGGTGKTRLATELAARERARYPDDAWFVPLAEIADAALVPSSIAQALGVRDLGTTPLRERAIASLGTRRLLLVLDNFEHVLAATPFVADLLAACPGVTILVTSRASLGIQGEQAFPVPPLAVPRATADAAASEAVQLFVARARAVRQSFAPEADALAAVAEICRRLDGLPLALELAAARAMLLSPRAILERLEPRLELLAAGGPDRPARHATMRAVIDWSYVLLTAEERALFCRLALFAGGASLEAAEVMAPAPRVLDHLASLGGKSLLQAEEQPDGEPRFVMLETVRAFGLERLAAGPDDAAARAAHRTYFVGLAERAAERLRGPDQAVWLDRLEREYANVRVALDGALGQVTPADREERLRDAARLAVALHRLWLTRGPLFEGITYLQRILAAIDAPNAPALDVTLRARVVSSRSHLAGTRSLFGEARDLFARSLALYRQSGDRAAVAETLNNLAWQVWNLGDLEGGEALSAEALAIHEALGNALGVALSRNNLAWIAMERGDFDRAEQEFDTVIASHQRRGEWRAAAFAVSWLGVLAARRGNHARAIALHERALEVGGPVADLGYRTLVLVRLAVARHALGQPGQDALIELEYVPALREAGRLWPLGFALHELGAMRLDRGDEQGARTVLAEALEVRRASGGAGGIVETCTLLGEVHRRAGERVAAATLFVEALHTARGYGAPLLVAAAITAVAALARDAGAHERAADLLAAATGVRAGTTPPDDAAARALVDAMRLAASAPDA